MVVGPLDKLETKLVRAGLSVARQQHGLRLWLRARLAPEREQDAVYQAVSGQDAKADGDKNRKGEND